MSQQRESSIQRFKRLTQDLQKEVRENAIDELNAGADELADQMRAVAPQGPTGNLKRSIRKEQGPRPSRVFIKAGGPLTTVKHGSAPPYDYANAIEFGTQQNGAHPFFWPSWRLRRKKIRSRMSRRITATIKQKSAS